MTSDRDLLESVNTSKHHFGAKCSKYAGALTVESLRTALEMRGIRTSQRDVFVEGVPVELDLILPKPTLVPFHRLVYAAHDVLLALEIKNTGCFGESSVLHVRNVFRLLREHNPPIRCCYVTLTERMGYKWAATPENIEASVYTLFWHNGSETHRRDESSGDWDRLLADMGNILDEFIAAQPPPGAAARL